MSLDVCNVRPEELLTSTICLDELSKNARGELTIVEAEQRECRELECRTLVVEHSLDLELSSHTCDSKIGTLLDGRLVARDLVTVFAGGSGERRGMHTGTFRWRAATTLIAGQLSGMTNEGTHREPAFRPCQSCDERGVMEGRFCGRILRSEDRHLADAQVFGAYRLRFDPSEGGRSGAVSGTLEGVVVRTCPS